MIYHLIYHHQLNCDVNLKSTDAQLLWAVQENYNILLQMETSWIRGEIENILKFPAETEVDET